MATSEEIKLQVVADTMQAAKNLGLFTRELDNVEKKSKKTASTLGDLKASYIAIGAIVAKTTEAFGDTLMAASNLEEQTNKFNVVFGTTPQILKQANNAVNELTGSFAMSERESRQLLAGMQDLLKPLGIAADKAADMSINTVKLAADMASFNNLPTTDVLNDIRSAMVGNYETVRKYGVAISDAAIKNQAFVDGLYSGKGEIDAQTKAITTLKMVMLGNADAMGDMARTSDSFANQLKKMGANVEDFKAGFGGEFISTLASVSDSLNKLGVSFKDLGSMIGSVASNLVGFNKLKTSLNLFKESQEALRIKNKETGSSFDNYFVSLKKGGSTVDNLTQKTSGLTLAQKKQLDEAAKKRAKEEKEEERIAQKRMKIAEEVNDYVFEATLAGLDKADAAYQKSYADEQKRYLKIFNDKILTQEQYEEAEIAHLQRIDQIKKDYDQNEIDQKISTANTIISQTADVWGRIQSIISSSYALQSIKLDNDYKKRRENIIKTISDEKLRKEAIDKLDAEFDKKRQDMQYKQAVANKAISLVSAIIGTAQGVVNALTLKPLVPLGIAMASIVSALGAAQIGIIASTPIPKAAEGGIIPGSTRGTSLIAGEGGRSEAIIPFENSGAMEKMGMGATIVNINIDNLYGTENLPDKLVNSLDKALYLKSKNRQSLFASFLK